MISRGIPLRQTASTVVKTCAETFICDIDTCLYAHDDITPKRTAAEEIEPCATFRFACRPPSWRAC
jgi:hypothetical protein